MLQEADRDILVRVDTTVKELKEGLIGPGGRIPQLEATQDDHSAKINKFSGSVSTAMWLLGGIGVLLTAFGGVLLAHIMGGK